MFDGQYRAKLLNLIQTAAEGAIAAAKASGINIGMPLMLTEKAVVPPVAAAMNQPATPPPAFDGTLAWPAASTEKTVANEPLADNTNGVKVVEPPASLAKQKKPSFVKRVFSKSKSKTTMVQ